jgi:hypothetical protein
MVMVRIDLSDKSVSRQKLNDTLEFGYSLTPHSIIPFSFFVLAVLFDKGRHSIFHATKNSNDILEIAIKISLFGWSWPFLYIALFYIPQLWKKLTSFLLSF